LLQKTIKEKSDLSTENLLLNLPNMLPTEQIQGLIPSIQISALNNSQLLTHIAELEADLKRLPITQYIQDLKKLLKDGELEEQQLREEGADIMLMNGLKEMKMLDGTTISLSKTP